MPVAQMEATPRAITASTPLEPYARRVVPRQSLRDLEAQITELTAHLNAATYYWLTLIAEFDRREGWSDGATRSCAHWLNWKCGIDLGAARERVRVAHALENLPRISEAMREGRLSYSKVRAITRVATEATEETFLQIAIHGTAHHVEKLVRVFRRAKEAEELSREAQQQERRGVMWLYDPDGSLVVKATLPAEAGALFIAAMEAAVKAAPPGMTSAEKDARAARSSRFPTVNGETPDRLAHRRADALARIAESYLKHGEEELSAPERQQIMVHVDVQTLKNSTAGRCELEDGPSLSAETVRRLACDASLVTIIESEEGEPLSVGRKTRAISPALRRALNARDHGCRFPGCPNTRYVDAHHIRHWAHGGETKPSNLVSLCRFHHRQVHEGRVTIDVRDDGALRFRKPTGESFESSAPEHSLPLGNWRELVADNQRRGLAINQRTATTRWTGEAMDYQIAIDSLLFRERRAARVSAATLAGTEAAIIPTAAGPPEV